MVHFPCLKIIFVRSTKYVISKIRMNESWTITPEGRLDAIKYLTKIVLDRGNKLNSSMCKMLRLKMYRDWRKWQRPIRFKGWKMSWRAKVRDLGKWQWAIGTVKCIWVLDRFKASSCLHFRPVCSVALGKLTIRLTLTLKIDVRSDRVKHFLVIIRIHVFTCWQRPKKTTFDNVQHIESC